MPSTDLSSEPSSGPSSNPLTRDLVVQRLRAASVIAPDADLPAAPKAVASYLPFRVLHHTIYVSGQLPLIEGKLVHEGLVPDAVSLEQAQACAARCVVNGLSAIDAALAEHAGGDWERVAGVAKLEAFVACPSTFTQQHLVANGASELIAAALGETGRHARAAVGVPSLPLNAPVEIALTVALRP